MHFINLQNIKKMQTIQFIQNTPQQLKDLISEDIRLQLNELKKSFQPKEKTEYLTRNEVAEMLKIDLSTLWSWTKKGKLISYGIQSRVYYKRKEVENAIIKLNQ